MNILKKIKKIPKKIAGIIDPKLKYIQRHSDITIISNNCLAGFIYQDLGLQYKSPTIGLQFTQSDFIKFCRNFPKYTSLNLEECEDDLLSKFKKLGGCKIDFPVGKIDDIPIFFQHYINYKEAKDKWEKRLKRINNKCLFFIFVAHDYTPKKDLQKFNDIDFPNKLLISNSNKYNLDKVYSLNCGNKTWADKINIFGKKYYQNFNFKKWIYDRISSTS